MAERYTRIYTLESAQYQNESPAIIAAGALLKDNKDDSVLVQLKFKSVSDKTIKALKAAIQPLDIHGELLGNEIEYQYLDLSAKRDEQFGQKVPIRLSDNNTEKFKVRIIDAVFEDDSKWSADTLESIIVSEPSTLEESLNNDMDLIEQFKLEYGSHSIVMPQFHESYWICSCSAFNRSDELKCHSCSNEKSILINIDVEALKERKDIRVKEDSYSKALSLANENTIDSLTKAISIMESLSGWKDSDEKCEAFKKNIIQLKDTNYENAIELASKNSLDSLIKAKTFMERLDGWKDSNQLSKDYDDRIKRYRYDEAVTLSKEDSIESLIKAETIMNGLNGWMDSAQKAVEYHTRIDEIKRNVDTTPPKPPVEKETPKIPVEEPSKKKKPNMLVIGIGAVLALVLLMLGLSGGSAAPTKTLSISGLVAYIDGETQYFTVSDLNYLDWDIKGELILYSDNTISVNGTLTDEDGSRLQTEHVEKAEMVLDPSFESDNISWYTVKKDGEDLGDLMTDDGTYVYLGDGAYGFVYK